MNCTIFAKASSPTKLFPVLVTSFLALGFAFGCGPFGFAQSGAAEAEEEEVEDEGLKIVAEDDFEQQSDAWRLLDPKSWEWANVDDRGFLSLYVKQASYKPPHRSPHHVAICESAVVGDFELTVSVRSTEPDYGHRDACIVFGFVDEAHFYYAHLGKATDPHCNQIFIVDGADRKAITTKTNEGTPWDDQWKRVKVTRDATSGEIAVYFEDFDKPAMTATDTTFPAGKVGLGSFDDRVDWDDFELRGEVAQDTEATSDAGDE